jgi:hypothetical protein
MAFSTYLCKECEKERNIYEILIYVRYGNKHKYGVTVTSLCKGKAIPLQAWTGPEGSRRLRLPHFLTLGT